MARQARSRTSSSGTSTGSSSPGATLKAKGKRGAPQTFAATLFRILHEGTPIVGWGPEGDSFTVHNDKEFEREILTANYRHGKFSSFQRQLNMYGFRKVPDCSDRTYSHPFFRRNCPDLLPKVRRVVPANNSTSSGGNGNSSGNSKASSAAAASGGANKKRPASGAAGMGAPSSTKTQEGEYGSHTTGESDGGDVDESRRPARKKARGYEQRSSGSSAAASGGAGAGGGGGGGLFPRPLQYGWADAGADVSPASVTPARRMSVGAGTRTPMSMSQQQQHRQQQHLHLQAQHQQQQQQYQQQQHQDYPSSWHHHTGLLGAFTHSCDDAWTSGSTSSSATSSIEASSPVLLPINTADLDCRNNVPPFHLPAAASISPACSSPTAAAGGGLGGAMGSHGNMGFAGGGSGSGGYSTMVQQTSASSAGVDAGSGRAGGVASSASSAAAAAAVAAAYDNPMFIDKALGFGTAIARCPSFDLIFNADDLVVEAPPPDTLGNASPAASTESGASAAAAAAPNAAGVAARQCHPAANGSIGFDLKNFGGPGWGNPDSSDSAASGPWAALPLPPLSGGLRVSRSSLSSMVGEGGSGGNGLPAKQHSSGSVGDGRGVGGGGGGAGGGGGGYGGAVGAQQQPRMHKRTLSTVSAFSIAAGEPSVDSLDWLLEDDDEADEEPLGGLMGGGSAGGGGFDDVAAFSGVPPGGGGGGGAGRATSAFYSGLSAPPPPQVTTDAPSASIAGGFSNAALP